MMWNFKQSVLIYVHEYIEYYIDNYTHTYSFANINKYTWINMFI